MALVFGYLHYFNETYIYTVLIPMTILAIFFITMNIFVIKSSRTRIEEKERTDLLFYIGIINIIFLLLPFMVPSVITIAPTEIEMILSYIYEAIIGTIRTVPFLITYGILMFKYGKANESRFHQYLKISGIIWIVTNSVMVITLGGALVSLLFYFTAITVDMMSIIFMIVSIFGLIELAGWALLIVHSVNNKDNDLLVAGILRISVFIVLYVYNYFVPILLGYLSP